VRTAQSSGAYSTISLLIFPIDSVFFLCVVMVTASTMANIFVNEEDSDTGDKRPNLLDVIEERNRTLNKVSTFQFISCMIDVLVVINRRLHII